MRLKKMFSWNGAMSFHGLRVTKEMKRLAFIAILVAVVLGCGRLEGGPLTTGKTVRQERPEIASGLGGYRLVKMPNRARRNLIEADPNSSGAHAYVGTLNTR